MTIGSNTINYLWLDGETTGLDPLRNDIVQLACIAVLNGVEQSDTFNQYCKPTNPKDIDPGALAVNGLTVPFLMQQQEAATMVNNLVVFARNFGVKFTIAGYNVGFDKDFLAALFKKVNREHDFLEIFTGDIRDTMKRAKVLKAQLSTPNIKLATLAGHFGIPINAHDALSDISATIKVDEQLSKMLGEVEIYNTEERPLLDVGFPEPAQLHLHSRFSHTDSLNSVNELAEYCSTNGIPGFSAVDHGNATSLYDIIKLDATFKKTNEEIAKDNKKNNLNNPLFINKVVGIPGCGLRLSTGGYLNAWATTDVGYRNLIKVASIGWTNRIDDSDIEFPTVSVEDCVKYKEGIVFGVPGINGPIAPYLLSRQTDAAVTMLTYLNDNLDLRLEIAAIDVYRYFDKAIGFRSYNIEGGNMQKHINNFYFQQAHDLDIKMVPVSDAHFLDPADKIVQDCVSRNSYKDARYCHESRHILKAREMYSIIHAHTGGELGEHKFQEMIDNTHEIMNAAAKIKIKHEYHLPKIEIPEDIAAKTDDYNMQTYYYMMRRIKEHGRWNDSPEYKARFKKEVEVIMKNETLNFLPYFLVYEDVCAYARSCGLMQGIARGSAGGSLLSYYLQIIHVDPVAANLPFERFLSHARIRAGSFPDIDLDIADRARPLVMKYLQDKYKLGFAQIATFNKMKTKNAIKDAMYSLYGRNRNDPEVKAICDSIPDSPQGVDEHDFLYGYIDQEDVEHKGQVQVNEMLANFFKARPEVEQMVKKLIGAIRGWSRHASAFVISTLDLSNDRVPTMIMSDKDLGEIMVTQFDASMVEKSGLVKADILGIKTLTMVSDCMDLVLKNHNFNFKEEEKGVPYIYRLPDADHGVFTDFYNKDTDSSFQFNTELIKGMVQEFCPLNRKHLADFTALARPGALDFQIELGGTIAKDGKIIGQESLSAAELYMKVKSGNKEPHSIHPDLDSILSDTYYVAVYQEQIMQILKDIGGFSGEESDMIRSAIAKKKLDVIQSTFKKLRDSALSRGWDEDQADKLCKMVEAFSRYSFNKSHSYAYAELGYITMYLKHYYKLEWWTAVLNNEGDSDKIRKYIAYLGDLVTAPSLSQPTQIFSIKDGKIVAPVSAIKSVGPAVVNELTSKGPFASLEDYVERINHSRVNIGSMSALIKARAADDMMDMSIPDYMDRRKAFMNKYVSLRKSKTEFKPEMFDLDPINIFLQEKEYNQSFNKSLMTDPTIGKILESKWPALKPTGRKGIPYFMKSAQGADEDIFVLGSLKVAEGLLKKGFEKEVAMMLLFDSSNYKQGVSKKTGKPWKRVSVMLSDGYQIVEATLWDAKKAFGWPKDTIVYVRGELKTGWKTPLSINITEIEKVQ